MRSIAASLAARTSSCSPCRASVGELAPGVVRLWDGIAPSLPIGAQTGQKFGSSMPGMLLARAGFQVCQHLFDAEMRRKLLSLNEDARCPRDAGRQGMAVVCLHLRARQGSCEVFEEPFDIEVQCDCVLDERGVVQL